MSANFKNWTKDIKAKHKYNENLNKKGVNKSNNTKIPRKQNNKEELKVTNNQNPKKWKSQHNCN